MEILNNLFIHIVPFLGIITVLVFVHELGHYLAARWNGVKVEVFSIGFGPEIFGWTDSKQTRWKISIFPLGGYVRMFSDANAASQPDLQKIMEMTEEDKKVSLVHKTVWQRIQVSIAGPLANYIFAIFVLAVLFAFHGQQIPTDKAKVGIVVPESAADKAGIKQNDEIVDLNGQKISSFTEMHKIVRDNPDKELDIILLRDNERKIIKITPEAKEIKDEHGKVIKVGVLGIMQGSDLIKRNPLTSLWYSAQYTFDMTGATLKGVWQMIDGSRSTEGLSGPIGIAKMTAEIAQTTWVNIFWFMAFLSINLGLINLFPIPMLDGGHLLFYFIEAIRGKPVSEKAQEYGFRVGLAIVLGLFLLSTWNDVNRFQWLKNLFN
jgi:regulator of sigma E protease